MVVAIVFFGLAGTLHDARAWLALKPVFFGSAGLITVWLCSATMALLERRVQEGRARSRDPMQNIVAVACAALVSPGRSSSCSGLDRRLGWSHVSLRSASLIGDGLASAIGFLVVFLTFRENDLHRRRH